MLRFAVMCAGAIALAGCSDSGNADGDGAISVSEAAKAAAASDAIRPQAGQYEATITMTGMEIPGMPPEMAGHGTGMTTTTKYCLTQDEVDKGFEEMLKQGQDGECSFDRFALSGGNMDAVMVCKTSEGDMRMEMTGTATPTSSDVEAKMAMNVEGLGQGTMSFTANHKRIGDCAE